jgi:site-specific recombinase XerD
MATVSQPFFKKSHDAWYCEIRKGDGSVKTKRLAKGKKNKKAADDERCRIVAMQADPSPDMPVRVLCAQFLRHCRQNNSPASLNWYKTGLLSFCRSIPKDLKVCDLRKWHVLNWVDERYPRVGPNKKAARTRHGMLYCVQRVFNWACDTDRLTANPLARLKKPKKTPREGYLMPEQFEKLAAKVHDRPFRDFLLTLRHTGCRPIEARTVEAVHFHPAERCWLMPNIGHGEVDEDASQMRRVPLNQMMMELTARLAKEHPTGPLFRNADGNAWTKDALHCRFYRLQIVLKFKVTPTWSAIPSSRTVSCGTFLCR